MAVMLMAPRIVRGEANKLGECEKYYWDRRGIGKGIIIQWKQASISDIITGYNIWKCFERLSGMCSGVRIIACENSVPTLPLVETSTNDKINEAWLHYSMLVFTCAVLRIPLKDGKTQDNCTERQSLFHRTHMEGISDPHLSRHII